MSSPNGSRILVYGHEQGLRVLWKGGRPFKDEPESARGTPKANGSISDAIMLDSSDEEPAKDGPYKDDPTFQDEENEYDPSEPYEPIIQSLDLPLGVEVLHLAFPHLPADSSPSSLASLPALLPHKMVVAVGCSDFSIRVISVPISPPSPRSKARPQLEEKTIHSGLGKSLFGEQVIVLSGGTTHQSIPLGVSISFTARRLTEDVDMEDDNLSSRGQPSSRHTPQSRSRARLEQNHTWDLLVASHSADLSGLLLVHRIPLIAQGTTISTELHIPWRTQYLTSPAVSVEFSPGLYPAPRHSQLLVAEENGIVRILDCLPSSKALQGSWLTSHYTEFETLSDLIPRRKPILSSRWILGGRAILVLLLDGEWGIWDQEGVGPQPSEGSNAAREKANLRLIAFALHGWVGDSSKSRTLLKKSSANSDGRSKLAPMTPSTRKMKQDALFTCTSTVPDGPARGGLFVMWTPGAFDTRSDDNSVLLWHRSNVVVIPSLVTFWQNKVRGSGNLFGSGAKGEPKTINSIPLGGDSCNEMGLIPSRQHTESSKNTTDQLEVLVTGEKRLVIISPPLPEPEAIPAIIPSSHSATVDQQLLARGELDVTGMDRLLSGMSNGNTPRRNPKASALMSGSNTLLQ